MQLKHSDIWRAIDRLAERHGLSASGLAKKAGLSSTVFNPSKRASGARKRWPSTESIAVILKATETSLDEFVALAAPESGVSVRTLPMAGTGMAQKETTFDEDGIPSGKGWEDIRFPALADLQAFALEIEGRGFEPLYRTGDRLILSPAETPRRGDRVVMRMKTGKIMIGEMTRESARAVELTMPGEATAIAVPMRNIQRIYRIVWASQ